MLTVFRCGLAAIFLYAGAVKLMEPGSFADSIASFQMLPLPLVSPLALALPTFEVLTGLALLGRWPRRLGAFCALALSVVFTVALTAAMVRGIPVDCGCFGAGTGWLPLSANGRAWFDLLRDVLLTTASFVLYRREASARLSAFRP